jgi:hypothetical protein
MQQYQGSASVFLTICDVLNMQLAQSHALPLQLHAAVLQHNLHTAI